MSNQDKHYFSFDVESVGLFGRPFAVGWVVVNQDGEELDSGYLSYPVLLHKTEDAWVLENVVPALPVDQDGHTEFNCGYEYDMLERFWEAWTEAKKKYPGIVMVSDCPWPVEANFLLRCQRDLKFGMDESPYPILDAASVLAAGGYDPLGTYDREPEEEPAHHPTNDARQSVRLMLQTMQEISRDRSWAIVHGAYGQVESSSDSTWTVTTTAGEWNTTVSAADASVTYSWEEPDGQETK